MRRKKKQEEEIVFDGVIPQPKSKKQKMMLNSHEGANIIIIGGAAGCLPAETEFMSQEGWKPISQYKKQDMVMQWNHNSGSELVWPNHYICDYCETMTEITDGDNVFRATDEHNVVVRQAGDIHEMSYIELQTYLLQDDDQEVEIVPWEDFSDKGMVFRQKHTIIERVETTDNLKYCFSVPSGKFVVRQNGEVFVTGNSGKSYSLLMHPLQFIHDPNFQAIVFRRNSKQLKGQGGLWETAKNMYSNLPSNIRPFFRERDNRAVFPMIDKEGKVVLDNVTGKPRNGATVQFDHLQHEDTKLSHQGLQYSAVYFDEGKCCPLAW